MVEINLGRTEDSTRKSKTTLAIQTRILTKHLVCVLMLLLLNTQVDTNGGDGGAKELETQIWVSEEGKLVSHMTDNSKQQHRRQVSEGSLQGMLVVELYLVNDLSRFEQYGAPSTAAVVRSSREIANFANLLFQPLGLMVVLVGVEVWTDRDRIVVSNNSRTALNNWRAYSASKINVDNDVAILLTRNSFGQYQYGSAQANSMCSRTQPAGVVRVLDDRSEVTGSVLAHFIGRILNISLDSRGCFCEDYKCIMDPIIPTNKGAKLFSSCSKEQLVASLNKGADLCLHNTPHSFNHYLAVCGNGIVETGEECDCGRLPPHMCNRKCCNENTCRLKGTCAQGGCCDVSSCSIRGSGYVCRPEAAGSCDLVEKCDGKSSFCPKDVFVQDGTVCSAYEKEGSCFGGRCGSREAQCKLLYGREAEDGSKDCYNFNGGSRSGHCGYNPSKNKYYPCMSLNRFCGSLQCNSVSELSTKHHKFLSGSSNRIPSSRCVNANFDYGRQVKDPGMVPDGSLCGKNMVCVNMECVKKEETSCFCYNGRCDSDSKCQCDQGFSGSRCELNVSEAQTGLIVGLIIFFLLLFLIAALFIYDYRHQQHAIKFFKDLADKYTPDSTAKSSSTPPKTRTTRPPLQKRDIINTSATDTPQISIIPTRAAPKPSKVNPAAATAAHNSIPNRFDNPAYVSEDLDAVGLGNSRLNKPFKPPLPKSLPSHPKSSGNDLEKPNANPPLPPVVPAWKQNKAKKTGQVQKPTIPPNPPKMNKKVSEVVRRFDEGHNNPNFNSSA